MAYHISLEVFEGPLDLLLRLIEEEEMEISSISLTRIIEQYLYYLQELGELDLETAASFLFTIMELMLLKTRRLLPGEDREILLEEKREELVTTLREYKTFRQAADSLKGFVTRQSLVYQRPLRAALREIPEGHPLLSLSLEALREAFLNGLKRKREERETIKEFQYPAEETLTIGEQVQFLREAVLQGPSSFYQLSGNLSLQDFIVTFLSLLELIRQGEVGVRGAGRELILYARQRREGFGEC